MRGAIEADALMPLAEGFTYGCLSAALREPDSAGWAGLRDVRSPALALVEPIDDEFARAMQEFVDAIAHTSLGDAQEARRELFPPVETPDCPTYESAYRGHGDWGQADIMADVAGFYRAHGLREGIRLRERPDHIGVELEFMSIVARKEADAIERGNAAQVGLCRETGDAFLRDHLGCWGIAFGRRVEQLSGAPYLRATGDLLATWLEIDMAGKSIVPLERVGGPIPAAFEPASGGQEGDGCASDAGPLQVIPVESIARRTTNAEGAG